MKKVFFFLMLSLITGCASVSVQKYYKDVKYPATNPGRIVIFPQKPAIKEFTDLGEITVTGANSWSQVEKIFRAKAAEIGGDAVYVFSKQEETKQYVSPDDCSVHHGYYYPYHHFGWGRYRPYNYYPRGYFYCYGYQSTIETATFITGIGIVIKYTSPK